MLGLLRYEVLKGLPGDGTPAKHFHTGHATPWHEGFAVKVQCDDLEWVGNFQASWHADNRVILWPEAGSIAVIAGGNFYLVDARDPDSYSLLTRPHPAVDLGFDEKRQVLLVAAHYFIYAFDVQRRLLWEKATGRRVRRIVGCVDGVLAVEVEAAGRDSGSELAQLTIP